MTHKVFSRQQRITYSECTVGNHVYHARFLDLLERVRGEFFREIGCTFLSLQEQDVIFPVVECAMKFKAPARYDDLVTIEMWIAEMERVRLSFASRVLDASGKALLETLICHGCTRINGRPRRLPATLVEGLRPFLRLPEQAASP